MHVDVHGVGLVYYCRAGGVLQSDVGNGCAKRPAYTRGQATLFGFKRRPISASPAFLTPPSSGATSPDSGNVTPPVDSRQHQQPLPSTPRPSRAKRPTSSATTSRFGFRAPSAPPATNKVGDVNCNTPPHSASYQNQHHQRNHNSAPPETRPRAKEGSRLVPPASYRMRNSNSPVDDNQNKNSDPPRLNASLVPPTKFTLHTSLLPKPQYPVRLSSADDGVISKGAKTAANNTRKECCEEFSSKEGSPTGDSGLGSAVAGSGDSDTLQGLEQLDASPTFGHRRTTPRRLLGTVVTGKYFDVRDLKSDEESLEDPNVITEISLISIPGTRVNHDRTGIVRERSQQLQQHLHMRDRSSSIATSSDEGHEDEGLGEDDDDEGEEKANRDRSSSEKVRSPPISAEEEFWGHGEAMAEGYTSSGDESPYSVTSSLDTATTTNQATDVDKPPRPVLLTIEDCRFAAIAATAPKLLIEDEKSPVDSVFSSSPPTSSASDLVQTSAQQTAPVLSPDTPGTPTNASNSLSLSEGRDFLIDDEIADQPGLTFDEGTSRLGGGETTSSGGCSSQMASIVDSSMTLVDSSPRPARKQDVSVGGSPARGRRMVRAGSVDTLSPCESLASDDLMMDFDSSQGSLVDNMMEGR
ncbi:hypothetical protein PR048_030740 [Dryococelus australis]|uniref:Uncharacterized protein n=1 Tax=Dryococelus australis TaxID=614101 RepID=A0ABQ9G9R6_9NEOP|nr:hypothetical protein PR048_030740 [Dryococelus australis]